MVWPACCLLLPTGVACCLPVVADFLQVTSLTEGQSGCSKEQVLLCPVTMTLALVSGVKGETLSSLCSFCHPATGTACKVACSCPQVPRLEFMWFWVDGFAPSVSTLLFRMLCSCPCTVSRTYHTRTKSHSASCRYSLPGRCRVLQRVHLVQSSRTLLCTNLAARAVTVCLVFALLLQAPWTQQQAYPVMCACVSALGQSAGATAAATPSATPAGLHTWRCRSRRARRATSAAWPSNAVWCVTRIWSPASSR